MDLCLVGVQMTPRKKDRSRGVWWWYIIILLRGSEAKTCMMQVRCNYLGPYLLLILGSSINDGGSGYGKENGQKTIGLD